MKKTRLLFSFLALLLIAGPWMTGCGSDEAAHNPGNDAPTRPEPPYDWADPELATRLDEALEGYAQEFGLYGAGGPFSFSKTCFANQFWAAFALSPTSGCRRNGWSSTITTRRICVFA